MDFTMDYDSREFWSGCEARQLLLPFCRQCEIFLHFPRSRCPSCWSTELEWREVIGTWILYTWVVSSDPKVPAMALVELEQQMGLRIPAPVETNDPGDLFHGQPMDLNWTRVDGRLVPTFAPKTA
jgi:hypothetical protein